MAIRAWHPGKIAVVWVVTLTSRFCLQSVDVDRGWRRPSDTIWFLIIVIAAAITWRWLGGREGRSS